MRPRSIRPADAVRPSQENFDCGQSIGRRRRQVERVLIGRPAGDSFIKCARADGVAAAAAGWGRKPGAVKLQLDKKTGCGDASRQCDGDMRVLYRRTDEIRSSQSTHACTIVGQSSMCLSIPVDRADIYRPLQKQSRRQAEAGFRPSPPRRIGNTGTCQWQGSLPPSSSNHSLPPSPRRGRAAGIRALENEALRDG
jgi:hypothetical protein